MLGELLFHLVAVSNSSSILHLSVTIDWHPVHCLPLLRELPKPFVVVAL